MPWGGRTPPWPHPSLEEGPRLRPPSPLALYIVGGGRAAIPKPWRLPLPPVTPLPPRLRLAKPCRDPATSTTTPSCYWISINLSSPLAGSRRRRRRCSVRVLNAEVPSVRRLVIGDPNHDEYDSIITIPLNASARDLQVVCRCSHSPMTRQAARLQA